MQYRNKLKQLISNVNHKVPLLKHKYVKISQKTVKKTVKIKYIVIFMLPTN